MALYAFDGTWNENQPKDEKDTNVRKFYEAYQGEHYYRPGVGTRLGVLGKFFGGLGGAGGKKRVEQAYTNLESFYAAGDHNVDVIGFSRGAALAMDFVNKIYRDGVNGVKPIEIRFLGVWDIVASFGIPGNDTNSGYHLNLPDNVKKCYHALAIDERRFTFRPKVLSEDLDEPQIKDRLYEVWFRGYHSDIGGGNENIGLSNISLYWLAKRAVDCGLKIPDEKLIEWRDGQNFDAPGKEPTDFIENDPRVIPLEHFVHKSVRFVPGMNNPPKLLPIMNSGGKIDGAFERP